MTRVLISFLLLATTFIHAQEPQKQEEKIRVELSGMIFNLPNDTLYISQRTGRGYQDYVKTVADKNGTLVSR